jgi:hypothetical protein
VDDLGPPTSYLTLAEGTRVLTSDGVDIGRVRHVLADADDDIFDGLVLDVRHGGHRFVDAPEVAELHERAVVLKLDAAAAERLPEPGENPAAVEADADDTAESRLQRKLRRAWDLISGNY